MNYEDHATDETFCSTLVEDGVLSNVHVAKMEARSPAGRPTTLLSALRSIADEIDHGRWVEWLVHAHHCFRLNVLEVDVALLRGEKFSSEQVRTCLATGNFPCQRTSDGWLVATVRPDLFSRVQRVFPSAKLYRAAATVDESMLLSDAFTSFADHAI